MSLTFSPVLFALRQFYKGRNISTFVELTEKSKETYLDSYSIFLLNYCTSSSIVADKDCILSWMKEKILKMIFVLRDIRHDLKALLAGRIVAEEGRRVLFPSVYGQDLPLKGWGRPWLEYDNVSNPSTEKRGYGKVVVVWWAA